ncbi:alcohol dehydrogenase family protein [Thalassobius sp. MITS945101]|uniref:alcohol dehydrogenase family protein n=1 Tax=Thalassobius sp. MITS945101 TaxID=3096994 RepID=UPI00399BFD32
MTLPLVMNAMVLTGHGGLDCLEWRSDMPVPQPKADEVLVKVGAAAVNNTDINTRIGWYSKSVDGDTASGSDGFGAAADADGGWSGALQFPRIQGADCCGRIVAVGADVSDVRLGERVLIRAMHAPGANDPDLPLITFGSERDGGFAEYATIRSKDALRITSHLSDVELASFPCAFSTAEGMIQRAGLGAERVLITGASGGVGSAAIQLAKRRGAHVTALTSASKAAALRDLGADETLNRDARLAENSFDVVLDLVGGDGWPHLLEALRPGGRYAVSGAIAGPIVPLDLRTLYLKDLSFHGCTQQADSVFEDLIGYIEQGEVKPTLAATYPLTELKAAQEMFLQKTHVGKIGITVSG